ncbi:hypothetical protein FQR65_LT20854 [Abscondita terminalis]|nr:hypothetical protein FQR65_LT20854 [Abscondita terminalis]
MPIDAKFPKEQYERLAEAADRADADGVLLAGRELERAVRFEAKKIAEKYFAAIDHRLCILFPADRRFVRRSQPVCLADDLQRTHRISIAGPSTLSALLNKPANGFRTLAWKTVRLKIASHVWDECDMLYAASALCRLMMRPSTMTVIDVPLLFRLCTIAVSMYPLGHIHIVGRTRTAFSPLAFMAIRMDLPDTHRGAPYAGEPSMETPQVPNRSAWAFETCAGVAIEWARLDTGCLAMLPRIANSAASRIAVLLKRNREWGAKSQWAFEYGPKHEVAALAGT